MSRKIKGIIITENKEHGFTVAEFFTAYYPMFVSFAHNYLKDSSVCEDLVQEAFVALIEHRKFPIEENNAKAFLYTTIRNKCLNHLRHEQVRMRYAGILIEDFSGDKDSEEFFGDAIFAEESSNVIIDAIEKLPEMGQQILNMSIDGLSNKDISQLLGISINTVKTHKARAYKTLRMVLSDPSH